MSYFDLFGHRYRVLVHPDLTDNRFAQFEIWANLNARDVPRINHRHDLSVFVLHGSFDVWIDGAMQECHAGEGFMIPMGTWATFNNPDEEPTHAVLTVSPGQWARHVIAIGASVADSRTPIAKPTMPEFAALHERDAELGVEMRLPGPPAAWLRALTDSTSARR